MSQKRFLACAVAQVDGGHVHPVTYEAVAAALSLCPDPQNACVAVLANDAKPLGHEIAQKTGLNVFAVSGPDLAHGLGPVLCQALAGILKEMGARFAVLPHTPAGMQVAPALAVALDASFASAVTSMSLEPDGITVSRPVANGKFCLRLRLGGQRAVVSVLPGGFCALPQAKTSGAVFCREYFGPDGEGTAHVATLQAPSQDLGLGAADVIVSAGRGVGKPENLDLIQKTADLFPRSAVAGSRTVCDLGWLPLSRQVGVTGQTVCPKLYMACGISGAFQHVAGMRGSRFVVSINKDPQAPIFRVSNVCVTEDLLSFLPLFIQACAD